MQIGFSPGAELGPAVSADGQRVAYEYFSSGPRSGIQIWVMDLSRGFRSASPIVADENYNSWPSWSPDGQWISFMSSKGQKGDALLTGQIYKVRVSDSTVVQLTHFPEHTVLGDSTSWSGRDRIAFEYDDNIYAVDPLGQTTVKLIDLKSTLSPGTLWGIEWSPDGSRLSFRGSPKGAASPKGCIWVADLDSHRVFEATKGPADDNPKWLDNEHIVFERWVKETEIRVSLLCLRHRTVSYLTRGHIDLSPAISTKGHGVVLFARADNPNSKLRSTSMVPITHLYAAYLKSGWHRD
jgi:Tol biopolymer transport system component